MNRSAGRDGRYSMGKSVEMVSYGMYVEVIEGLIEVRPYKLFICNKDPFLVSDNIIRK